MFRFRWWIFASLSLGLFAWSAAPSVTGGDAGELLNASWTLGVAHPPGYPLYTLLAFFFAKLLPFGEVAWRYNFFSGVCGVAAGVVLGRLVERMATGPRADPRGSFCQGLITASLACFSPLAWRYSVVTEVFALNQLIVASFLSLLWRFLQDRTTRNWLWLCFVAGLGASHHHTSVLVTGPILLGVLWSERERGLARTIQALGAGLSGLIPYAYLLWAAQSVPHMAWGDTSTLAGALTHFLRREYGTFQLGNELTGDAASLFKRLWIFFRDLVPNSALGIGLLLSIALLGEREPSHRRTFLRLSILGAGVYLVVFCHLANLALDRPLGLAVQSRFWLLGILFFSMWAGLGSGMPRWKQLRTRLAIAICVALTVWGVARESQRGTTQFRDYARAVLESLPGGSMLLFEGDHAYGALYYVQKVQGIRPDLTLLHLNFLSRPWSRRWAAANYPGIELPVRGSGNYGSDGYALIDLVSANRAPGREVFTLNSVRPWDRSLEGRFRRVPWGMAEWLVPETVLPAEAFPVWRQASDSFFRSFAPPWQTHWKIGDRPGQNWEEILAGEYLDARHNFAVGVMNFVQAGLAGSASTSLSKEALAHLEYMKPIYGAAKPPFWKNYGLVHYQLLPANPAFRAVIIESWSRYLAEMKDPDPQRPTLEQILRQLQGASSSDQSPAARR